MHHLRSNKSLLAFRLGALGLMLFVLNVLATLMLGPISLLTHDPRLLRWTLWTAAGLPVTGLFYLMWAWRARCPLCTNPPLIARGCQKHHRAATLLGSYRLRVSLAVSFLGRFTCPYCGEPTRCEVRTFRRPYG